MKKFYITTTLPYVNADPHIGFAAEIIKADVIARYRRMQGDEVFFNTGTDEHGLKIYRKAEAEGLSTQEYCDVYAAKFNNLKTALNLSYNSFIRTTDAHHIVAAQEFWKKCEAKGDIYKKNYKTRYCVGCEEEKTESELVNDRCPMHPNLPLEIIEEENYFFRWSNYQQPLLDLYEKNPDFVVPHTKLNEIKAFVERGLNDFSISRLKTKMPWGIAVPGDESQVMYVWFDALVNYVSCLGYPDQKYSDWWPGLQVCGKDNLRFQSAMWQAMLMSADILPSEKVLIFGFITVDGQKMSKSMGNVINPYELVEKYGVDATRYFLLAEMNPFDDGDFSYEKFEKRYDADLANGLGNLASRVSNLLEKNEIEVDLVAGSDQKLITEYNEKMDIFSFDEALKLIWSALRDGDKQLTDKTPWKLTDKQEIKEVLEPIAQNILNAVTLLVPFMPGIAENIIAQFTEKQIKKGSPLFPRIQ